MRPCCWSDSNQGAHQILVSRLGILLREIKAPDPDGHAAGKCGHETNQIGLKQPVAHDKISTAFHE